MLKIYDPPTDPGIDETSFTEPETTTDIHTTPLTQDKEERYRKVKSKGQAYSTRIKRLRSDLDEGVENPSARTRFNRYMSEEDRKVLSEKLHDIRNIINEELGRPNDKDLIFFPDKRFSIDSDGVVYFNDKNLSIKKTGKPRKISGIFEAMGGKKEAIKIFNIATSGGVQN